MNKLCALFVVMSMLVGSAGAAIVAQWDFELPEDSPQPHSGVTSYTAHDRSGNGHGAVYSLGWASNGNLANPWSAQNPTGSNIVLGNHGGNAPAGNDSQYFSMHGGDYLAIEDAQNGDLDVGTNDWSVDCKFMRTEPGGPIFFMNDASNGYFVRVWFQPDGRLQGLFQGPGTERNHWYAPAGGLTIRDWHTLSFGISSGATFMTVDGNVVAGQDTTLGNWQINNVALAQFNRADFGAPHYYSGFLSLDDVVIDVVPEPATMMLLGLGSMALIRRRR